MDTIKRNSTISDYTILSAGEKTHARSFIANVFLLMFIALGVSALFAWQFSINENLLGYLVSPTGIILA